MSLKDNFVLQVFRLQPKAGLPTNIYSINDGKYQSWLATSYLLFTKNADWIRAFCSLRMHAHAVPCLGRWSHVWHLYAISINSRLAVPHFLLSSPYRFRFRIFPWGIPLLKRNWNSLWIRYQSLRKMSRKTTHLTVESGIISRTLTRNFPRTRNRDTRARGDALDFAR